MNLSRWDKITLALGAAFGGYVVYALVMINDDRVLFWNTLYGILYTAWLFCLWGMLRGNRLAYRLSFLFAAAAFGFGVYVVRFAWSFWIFEEPTIQARLQSVLRPQILVFAAAPLFWAAYFSNPFSKGRFGSGSPSKK